MLVNKLPPISLAIAPAGTCSAVAQQPIGRTSATEVKVSGAVEFPMARPLLGNGSEITAGDQAVKITLQRGGELRLCSTSSVHLAKDRSIDDPANSALMMALDRGAIEANYAVGKYSDVLLTPDLRILISGPGQAELSIRVNTKGDTCIDNHGADAPYVTVSSQLEGGAYRVLPDQRVSFQHGSLREVVDHEPEPCGCPAMPVTSVASTGNSATAPAAPGRPVVALPPRPRTRHSPSRKAKGWPRLPLPAPCPPVPTGRNACPGNRAAHLQRRESPAAPAARAGLSPLRQPEPPVPAIPAAGPAAAVQPPPGIAPAAKPASHSASCRPAPHAPQPEVASAPANPSHRSSGFFHRIGHFFSRIFGQ